MPAPPRRRPNTFSTAGLDRRAALRKDAAAIAALLSSGEPLVVPLSGPRVAMSGQPPRLVTLTVGALDAGRRRDDLWFLGELDGRAVVAVDVDDDGLPDLEVTWTGLREVASLLPAAEANVLAAATGLATWHRSARFCGSCGAETASDWAGHRRVCGGCGREHFPRTDPAIIVLVTFGDRCLLARNPAWPQRFASALAGFVEPGESLEDAVVREVKEEVGVDLDADSIEYHSSQPWPFPSSVMLGFTAEAINGELHPDPEEVADAAWWTAGELRDGAIGLPPPLSIARRLIDDWLDASP